MTQEREQTRTHGSQHDDDPFEHDYLAPGRINVTANMSAPTHPIASALIMRKARDANGVAAHAEHAVASASGSGGSSLPEPLREKFESSLGVDLSSVRVHTGDQSVEAAGAVGAKAYTVGNEIHFNAGEYDPGSEAGQHLIAHEVAHTVQQSGGAPSTQYKLEVSSPGDHLEVEADRAADAMIHGAPTTVTMGSGVQRKVMRKPTVSATASGDGSGSLAISIPVKKVPDMPLGGWFLLNGGITIGGQIAYAPTKKAPEPAATKPSAGKPTEAKVSGGTDSEGEVKVGIEISQELEDTIAGAKATVSGGVEVSNKSISLTGVSLELASKFGPVDVSFKAIELKLLKWEAGELPEFAVVEMSTKATIPCPPFEINGKTYTPSFNASVTVGIRPDPKKVAELIARNAASMVGAELAVVGGIIAAGAATLFIGAYQVLSAGDATKVTEPEIKKLRGYCLAYANTIRGAPVQGRAGSAEGVAAAKAFLAPLEARYTAGAVAEAAKQMPDPYASAWNQMYPKVKADLIAAYWEAHNIEKWMTNGEGYGNGGFKTFKMLLDGWDRP